MSIHSARRCQSRLKAPVAAPRRQAHFQLRSAACAGQPLVVDNRATARLPFGWQTGSSQAPSASPPQAQNPFRGRDSANSSRSASRLRSGPRSRKASGHTSATVVLPGMISITCASRRSTRPHGAPRLDPLHCLTFDTVVHRHTHCYILLCSMNRNSVGRYGRAQH